MSAEHASEPAGEPAGGECTSLEGEPAIPDDDTLYRRLSSDKPDMVSVDRATGERRPSSGAFKPDADGLSVFRRSKLEKAALTVKDVATQPQNVIVSVTVAEVRSIEALDVCDDPWPKDIPDAEHPRNGAHALIVGWTGGRKIRHRLQVRLAELAVFEHPAARSDQT